MPLPCRMQSQSRTHPGEFVPRPVGADDHIGPFHRAPNSGVGEGFYPSRRAPSCLPMGFVKTAVCPARADVVIGPYGILRGRHHAHEFVILYRAGGVEPLPYVYVGGFYVFAGVRAGLRCCTAREGQAPPLRYDEKRKGQRRAIGSYRPHSKNLWFCAILPPKG